MTRATLTRCDTTDITPALEAGRVLTLWDPVTRLFGVAGSAGARGWAESRSFDGSARVGGLHMKIAPPRIDEVRVDSDDRSGMSPCESPKARPGFSRCVVCVPEIVCQAKASSVCVGSDVDVFTAGQFGSTEVEDVVRDEAGSRAREDKPADGDRLLQNPKQPFRWTDHGVMAEFAVHASCERRRGFAALEHVG